MDGHILIKIKLKDNRIFYLRSVGNYYATKDRNRVLYWTSHKKEAFGYRTTRIYEERVKSASNRKTEHQIMDGRTK